MVHEIVLPQLGLTMEEGAVTSWTKRVGDRVEKGEILFTIETDKVEMEVESSETGFLTSILVGAGEKVPVGTVVAYLGDQAGEISPKGRPDNNVASASPNSDPALQTSTLSPKLDFPPPESIGGAGRPAPTAVQYSISPRARRLSKELNVDIAFLKPARGSRIVEEDVRRFHERGEKTSVAGNGDNRISATRTVAAQRLSESFQRAPHFYVAVEGNARSLVSLREKLRTDAGSSQREGITYTDLLLRALAMAVKDHPDVNAHWDNGSVRPLDSVDVGFAVQAPTGLIVPIIRRADQMSFKDFVSARQSLTDKALTGRLAIHDVEGGSATLTNLGSYNVDWFQAVLNPPQSVILATGRIARRATVVEESIRVCPTVLLSLSADHRVLDGVAAARFLDTIVKLIEDPNALVA